MNLRESALVAFTLLMQVSVGMVLVLAALPLLHGSPAGAADSWPHRLGTPLAVAVAAAALGLLASLLHLGHPTLAWLALANVRASWLSREVILALVFVAALGVAALSDAVGRSPASLRTGATAIAVMAGVALVFAMARLYMIAGQPAWNGLTTPVTFFASTMLLGLAAIVAFADPPLQADARGWLMGGALALLALQVLLVPGFLARVPSEPAAALATLSDGRAALVLASARVIAALAGAVLLVVLLRGALSVRSAAVLRYAALALVVVSEVFGRVLFYAASARL